MALKYRKMSKGRRLYFTKMQGCGNDYVYVDALGTPTSIDLHTIDLSDLSRKISDRHFGVGSDGLIVIMPSASADFRMRMFNADGSEAQMCGNGSRCVAKYLYDKGFTDKLEFTLETLAGVKTLHLLVENGEVVEISVDMGRAYLSRKDVPAAGDPDSVMKQEPVIIGDECFKITAVGMGNPHGVIFADKITDRHIRHYGRIIETLEIWPERANIEFVEVKDRRHIKMRVWERGAGETLACGTGACASVVAGFINGLVDDDVEVELPGGKLNVSYDSVSGHVKLRGCAEFVAEGVCYLD